MTRKLIALVAALLLTVAACGSSDSAGGQAEAIGVEGAWTIDVVNADGSVADHREFHNALTGKGAAALAAMLGGGQTPYVWAVTLDNTAQTTDPCVLTGGTGVPCGIWEPSEAGNQDASANSFNLTVELVETVPSSGVFDAVRLAGSVAASNDGAVGIVGTELKTCPAGQATCGNVPLPFTSTVLVDPNTGADAPIPVTVGQSIQVEVVLSFGTL